MRKTILTAMIVLPLINVASAETFRWAGTTDPQTMDPHAVNTAPVLGFLNNVYEGLVRRGKNMAIEPALAESWEPIGDGKGWRFNLRKNVSFHDGSAFNATDVLFSYERASSEVADTRSWFAPISEVKIVDDFTVDFYTKSPNPIFPDSIANWMMMDSDWANTNKTIRPDKENGNYATLNANGTGAFMLADRQPGLSTTLKPYKNWWDKAEHNITEAVFTPIDNPATAIAALLADNVDMVNPIPIQDADRIDARNDTKVIRGIEARVIMLGFGHDHSKLKYTSDAGKKNPFQDKRVREAISKAINVDAIRKVIMRDSAEAASQLVSPAMRGFSEAHAASTEFDVTGARALLADAGYADGFSFGLKCPNNRYLNDEAVCQAMTGMLAKIGVTAELDAMPVQNYWPELRADNFDMYLLGWSPGTFDHEHPIRFLVSTPNAEKKLGSWNFGGFSNARVDELLPMIQSEIDDTKRQAMIDEAVSIYQSEYAYVPLYIQPLAWGIRENIELTQRPDNFFILRWVTVK